jgi:hypothetical protein
LECILHEIFLFKKDKISDMKQQQEEKERHKQEELKKQQEDEERRKQEELKKQQEDEERRKQRGTQKATRRSYIAPPKKWLTRTFVATPPKQPVFSIIAVFKPLRAAEIAQEKPVIPPPQTIKSYSAKRCNSFS